MLGRFNKLLKGGEGMTVVVKFDAATQHAQATEIRKGWERIEGLLRAQHAGELADKIKDLAETWRRVEKILANFDEELDPTTLELIYKGGGGK